MVLSCRTALALFKPPVLFEDPSGSGTSVALAAEVVSITKPGDRPRPDWLDWLCWIGWLGAASVSIQSAGVGGTGPNDATPLGGGRRVGGEIIGTVARSMLWTLCDLEDEGGGPGGGGGSGMPGSHLVCDVDRDR